MFEIFFFLLIRGSSGLRPLFSSAASVVYKRRMLGKGGFGVVHLGSYLGEQIDVKQLLEINGDNVDRFRFECFLMKNLRHPNIVKLVGVCLDDCGVVVCISRGGV